MRFFPHEVTSIPALVAFLAGFVVFLVTLLLARRRGARAPRSADARRSNASIGWIVVQGLGIGFAGVGPLAIASDPWTAGALAQGAVVLALMLAAAGLFDASSRAMGRNWALVARTREDGQLVQSGPFARVRNPIYIALFLFMLAMAIAYGHVANLIVAVPLFALGTGMRVRHEEVVLRATFGAAYEKYAARVKRFVPGVL